MHLAQKVVKKTQYHIPAKIGCWKKHSSGQKVTQSFGCNGKGDFKNLNDWCCLWGFPNHKFDNFLEKNSDLLIQPSEFRKQNQLFLLLEISQCFEISDHCEISKIQSALNVKYPQAQVSKLTSSEICPCKFSSLQLLFAKRQKKMLLLRQWLFKKKAKVPNLNYLATEERKWRISDFRLGNSQLSITDQKFRTYVLTTFKCSF